MATRLLLTEGGVAGHMAHVYDNGELPFGKIKELFTAASSGELQGTEKTDGQNLFISYSVKRGIAVAARNKGNIKQGGMPADALASKFDGRGGLADAFNESFDTFERAVRSLDPQTQLQIFGNDAEIYYNAEVMDPRSPNVVNYDTKSLVIHQTGHGEFSRETGAKTDKDVSEYAKVLSSALQQMQDATQEQDYTVYMNAVKNLEALEDDLALSDAIDRIDALTGQLGLSDDDTIDDYMIARLAPVVKESVPEADEETQKKILQRLVGGGINFNDIVRGVDREMKEAIRTVVKSEKSLRQKAIAPLEMIIHDFSVEMLRGMESAFILDNTREVDRLRGEVRTAINAIENSGNEQAMELLKRHMAKLKDVENVSTASEGFVFDFDGQTYKFTGNFAPINQILGLFKYGRGDIPAMVKEETNDLSTHFNESFGSGSVDVAVIPGAFKPPHRGHLAMIAEYAKMAKRVIVFMSPLARDLPDGRKMTFDMAYQLWDSYLKSAGLNNVKVLESPVNSPVGATFKFVANEEENPDWAQEGEAVVLGVSTKGGDDSRFSAKAQQYAKDGVKVLAGGEYAVDPSGPEFTDSRTGKPLSATVMRTAIAERDLETFSEYLPQPLRGSAEEILNKLTPEEEETVSEMIFRMINESLDEQCGSAMASSGIQIAVSKPSSKKKKNYNPWDTDDDEELNEFNDSGNEVIDIDALGVPRSEMPQIKSTDMQEFRQWLEQLGVSSDAVPLAVGELKPIQSEINLSKIDGMLQAKSIDDLANSKPVLVSSDKYLIDGHHRWFALKSTDPSIKISTILVDMGIDELLEVAHDFPKVSYKTTVDEGYENFGGQSQMIKVGNIRIDIEDMELEPTKHGEERRFRHQQGGKGHKISKNAIIQAVDRAVGLIMNDYANGELGNNEPFHIRMKGKSNQVPALNVIGVLDMKKGPDTMKIITVMRKDNFKTDNFGGKGGPQKTYNVGA